MVTVLGEYVKHGFDKNGLLTITLKMTYDEMSHYVGLLGMMEGTELTINLPLKEPQRVGWLNIHSLNINSAGVLTATLKAPANTIETDVLEDLALLEEEDRLIRFIFEPAETEEDDETEEPEKSMENINNGDNDMLFGDDDESWSNMWQSDAGWAGM